VFIAAEEMINLHHGQGFDIFWRDHQICPTEEEYKKMVLDSTRTSSPCALTPHSIAYATTRTLSPLTRRYLCRDGRFVPPGGEADPSLQQRRTVSVPPSCAALGNSRDTDEY
jgi:hypothetical protein